MAKQLVQIVREAGRLGHKPKLDHWAMSMQSLIDTYSLPVVEAVLDWYGEHHQQRGVPWVYSPTTLTKKFDQIKSRVKKVQAVISKDARQIYEGLERENLVSGFSGEMLLKAIQQNLDIFDTWVQHFHDMTSRLTEESARIEKQCKKQGKEIRLTPHKERYSKIQRVLRLYHHLKPMGGFHGPSVIRCWVANKLTRKITNPDWLEFDPNDQEGLTLGQIITPLVHEYVGNRAGWDRWAELRQEAGA